ncbi:MAG: VCBS repeat-containing protein [Planctomycetaceae bacterium]
MNRGLLAGFIFLGMLPATTSAQQPPTRELTRGEQHRLLPPGEQIFSPGRPVAVSPTRHYGQIGQIAHLTMSALGTADVFGNGPYDLFLDNGRLFPFLGFDADGQPYYGAEAALHGEIDLHCVLTAGDGIIYGLRAAGRQLQLATFDRGSRMFATVATSPELDLPHGMATEIVGWLDASQRLHVYFALPDGNALRNDPNHHAATYLPYDGAGFWRGNIPRLWLYHVCFDSVRLEKVEQFARASDGPGEFLFSVSGMAVLDHGTDHPPGLAVSDQLSTMRYFPLDPETGKPGPMQFLNSPQHVALRHPVIRGGMRAVPDRDTGLSNLIVTDTGRAWFYKFGGEWTKSGAPIYHGPAPLLAEKVHLALGPLCVISPGDMDRDGLVDLMVGNDSGHLLFLRNIGTPQAAAFDLPVAPPVGGKPLDIKAGYSGSVQGPQEAMWGYTCPTVCDWNGDGLLDVVLNSITADYQVLLQRPCDEGIAFAEPRLLYCDSLQLQLAWRSQPGITDWGLGGRLCMIALDEQNLLRMFWRIDDENVERGELLKLQDGSPITANVDEFAGQTGRGDIVPYDWDGDGTIDLMIGASRGQSFPASQKTYYPSAYGPARAASLLYFRNAGTNAQPVFEYARLIEFEGERISLGIHLVSPAFFDIGRGVDDVLIGEELGAILYYPREKLTVSPPAE